MFNRLIEWLWFPITRRLDSMDASLYLLYLQRKSVMTQAKKHILFDYIDQYDWAPSFGYTWKANEVQEEEEEEPEESEVINYE